MMNLKCFLQTTPLFLSAPPRQEKSTCSLSDPLVSVSPAPTGEINMFTVRKVLVAPGENPGPAAVKFHRKGMEHTYPDDIITLDLKPNPSTVSGEPVFGNGVYEYDFGRYIDNELGVFRIPEGKSIRVEKQSGKVVIENTDGTSREEYTVSRRNFGLPVTWMHGIWWCKYNSMGNSRDFSDQILSSDDPAAKAGQTLFEYLTSCSAEEYYRLWGWAYIGDSTGQP